MSRVLTAVAIVYLAIGFWFGFTLWVSMPALNGFGIIYITLEWPHDVFCSHFSNICDAGPPAAIAPYLFTFNP